MTDLECASLVQPSHHQTLEAEIAEWREWWGQRCEMGQPCFGEMATRLQHYRDHLRQHFTAEEHGGCLSIVKDMPAQQVAQISTLQDEHRKFLNDLERLIERLQRGQPAIKCWGQARDEFEDFLDRLHRHEQSEDEIAHQKD